MPGLLVEQHACTVLHVILYCGVCMCSKIIYNYICTYVAC